MSSYGSTHSGQLRPGCQPQQQRTRSHSNPPYPTTPETAPYPHQQQLSYFTPPPTAPYQQVPPTTAPIAIPTSNHQRASSDYGYCHSHSHSHGALPSHPPPTSPYANSYPTQHLQPIPQQQHIPETYLHAPQQQPQQQQQQQQYSVTSNSPSFQPHHHHYRPRRSSSSQNAYNPRQSYESAHSFQSAHSQPSPDYYARSAPLQNGHARYGDWHGWGIENVKQVQAQAQMQELEPPKDYGDWDKEEITRYRKNKELERRPTLGGSLMSLVRRVGGSERR